MVNENLLKLFHIAYGKIDEKVRLLDFKTEGVNTDDAVELVMGIGSYNDFEGQRVTESMQKFKGKVMYWEVGREGSPVIYVHLPFFLNQQEGFVGENRRIIDDENIKLIEELKKEFVDTALADEFNVTDYSDRVVRIWWD